MTFFRIEMLLFIWAIPVLLIPVSLWDAQKRRDFERLLFGPRTFRDRSGREWWPTMD
jgi:hypothetical protein